MGGSGMAMESGITVNFSNNEINIRTKTLKDLRSPRFVHIFINEKERHLLIRRCEERDNDAFPIDYAAVEIDKKCRFKAKPLVIYLASVIGLPYPSKTLRFYGNLMEDGDTVLIDLDDHQFLPYLDRRILGVRHG
jgi:hypothetical protein